MKRMGWLLAGLCSAASAAAVETAAVGESVGDEPVNAQTGLEYRLIGPNVGGRITRVSGVVGDPYTFYLAAAQGGLWKSTDGGHDWRPIFDKQLTQSLGALAVAPSDPNVIYVGGGEANIRGNVQPGDGLFVSTDAGKTWTQGFASRGAIGHIDVHPTDANIAFAAVLGSPFKANPERGVYRTRDGGKSWQNVLKVDADTGASDVYVDRNNPRIVWAGTWQTRRTPWGMQSGGPGGGLWRSTDMGDSWTRLKAGKHGLPKGDWGKVGVAVSPANSERVWALIEAKDGGLFRSDDGGENFTLINAHWVLRQRAWYYTTVEPDPVDADTVWFPQVSMLKSVDGGKTLQAMEGFAHGDHHDLWIDPSTPTRMIGGQDGGVDLTVDGGKHWRSPDLPLGQFYNIDVDNRTPYHVGGTLQDMGTVSGPVYSLNGGGSSLSDWQYVGGGEAGDFRYDLAQEGVVYAGEYGGYLSRYREGSGQYRNISAAPANPSGQPPKAMQQRFQWTAPVELSPHDPATIYHGANVLYRSRDRGETWQIISSDLTRNDKSKQEWAGGPITGDNTGVEIYSTIFSISESALTKGELWVGSDDGLVHVSRDDGANWKNVSPRELPVDATVDKLIASRHQAGRAYLVAHRYRLGDDQPMVWVTNDHGASWRSLAAGLPKAMPLMSIAEDETDPQALYLGGERAIHASVNGGQTWSEIQLNLPHVAVVDIEAKHGDLIVGTRGRAMWVFEHVDLLRQILQSKQTEQTTAQLASTAVATRWRSGFRWGDADEHKNPDYGTQLRYYLPEGFEGKLTLRIVSEDGSLVRELSSVAKPAPSSLGDPDGPSEAPKPELSTKAGWNTATWDLSHTGAKPLLDAKIDAGEPGIGPLALPGSYRAELIGAAAQPLTTTIKVRADPRSPADPAALAAQLEFALQARSALDRATHGIELLRAARKQATELKERLAEQAAYANVISAADKVIADADRIEGLLHNPEAKVVYDILRGPRGAQLYSQLAPLYSWAQQADGAPTAAMRSRFAELDAEIGRHEQAIAVVRADSIAKLEASVVEAKLPRVILPGG